MRLFETLPEQIGLAFRAVHDSPDNVEGYLFVTMYELFILNKRDTNYHDVKQLFDYDDEFDRFYELQPEDLDDGYLARPLTNWADGTIKSWQLHLLWLDTHRDALQTDYWWEDPQVDLAWQSVADNWGFVVPIERGWGGNADYSTYRTRAFRLSRGEAIGVARHPGMHWNRYHKDWMSYSDIQSHGRKYQRCSVCSSHNKQRTDMVPLKYLSNMDGRAKSVCLQCVGFLQFITVDIVDEIFDADVGISRDYHLLKLADNMIGYGDGRFYLMDIGRLRVENLDVIRLDEIIREVNSDADRTHNRQARKIFDAYEHSLNVWSVEIPDSWIGNRNQFLLSQQNYNYRPPIFLNGAYRIPFGDNLYYSRHVPAIENREDWVQEYGPFYGVEIEVKVREDRKDWRTVTKVMEQAILMFHPDNYPEYYLQDGPTQLVVHKRDGSLQGDSTEFVTQPLSYDYWTNHIPDRFWEYFRDNFMGRAMDDYGIHIHIGYDAMDIPHRWVFLELLESMMLKPEGVLRAVAGRGSNDRFAIWQPLVFRGARHRAFEVARQKHQTGTNDKYWAVNTTHGETLELRMFQSNTGKNSILGMIQFVQNLWSLSKSLTEDIGWDYEDEDQAPPEMLLDRIRAVRENGDDVFMRWVQRYHNQDTEYLLKRLATYPVVEERYNILERE